MAIRITDGTETVQIESIQAYAADYSFTEPGDVEARVIDEDGVTLERFTIRSDDGRRGYLLGYWCPHCGQTHLPDAGTPGYSCQR